MIQAADLRIGNLLLWNPKLVNPNITLPSFPIAVSAILYDRIGYVSPAMDHRVEPFEDDLLQLDIINKPIEEFEPIALTTDLFERSGFKDSSGGWICNGHPFIKLSKEKKDSSDGFLFDVGDNKTSITFLHQLQNLHYALTGAEMEVNL